MNLHKCPSCRSFSAHDQSSFSPQRVRSRPYFNENEGEYLTPANKDPPKCNNETSWDEKEEKNCYYNPLTHEECIYKNNFWQEPEKDICFPKVGDEETTMDDILHRLPNNPTDENIRQVILQNNSILGIIPSIEHQLQEVEQIPKIPETGDGDHLRPMTAKDFDELDHKFGEEMTSPLPSFWYPEGSISPRYTHLGENRFVGKNPIPQIEARHQHRRETEYPDTYQSLLDQILEGVGNEDLKEKWKNWFLMEEEFEEQEFKGQKLDKEQVRDQPLPWMLFQESTYGSGLLPT